MVTKNNIERNNKCSCGSTLKFLEHDKDGNLWVICVGIGCDKKYPLRRKEDKELNLIHKTADAWHY